jgi:hypothetical protein
MRGRSRKEGDDILALWEEQIRNEVGAIQSSVERFEASLQSMRDRKEYAQLPSVRTMMLQWYKPLVDAIRKEQLAVRSRQTLLRF